MRHAPSPEGPFKVGDCLLDKYEVRSLLGHGGHAFVYDCYDAFLAQHVAIKVIPNPPHRGQELVRRAREEARVLFRLDHPNVVSVTNAGELGNGMVYIVMEKLEGKPLRSVLQKLGRLSVPEALHMGLQIAEGVAAAHSLNVIHRDLKPENAFVLRDNRVKVLDFGVAKFLGYGIETTQKHLFHGTLLYMSPEHLQGFGVTFRSDIYALGIMLYEMIAGINPCLLAAETPSVQQLAWVQIAQVPPPLDKLVRAVPSDVVRLVKRASAKQAAQRYASMREFADAIRASLERWLSEPRGQQTATRDALSLCGAELTDRSALPTGLGHTVPLAADPQPPKEALDVPRAHGESPSSQALRPEAPEAMAVEVAGGRTSESDLGSQATRARESPQSDQLVRAEAPESPELVAGAQALQGAGPLLKTGDFAPTSSDPPGGNASRLSPRRVGMAALVGVLAAIPIGVFVGVERHPGAPAGPSLASSPVPVRPATKLVTRTATSVMRSSGQPLASGLPPRSAAMISATHRAEPPRGLAVPKRSLASSPSSRPSADCRMVHVPAATSTTSRADAERVRQRAILFDQELSAQEAKAP